VEILEDSITALDGRIKAYDRLLFINGTDVRHCKISQASDLIKVAILPHYLTCLLDTSNVIIGRDEKKILLGRITQKLIYHSPTCLRLIFIYLFSLNCFWRCGVSAAKGRLFFFFKMPTHEQPTSQL
jgi:hypothetical protein